VAKGEHASAQAAHRQLGGVAHRVAVASGTQGDGPGGQRRARGGLESFPQLIGCREAKVRRRLLGVGRSALAVHIPGNKVSPNTAQGARMIAGTSSSRFIALFSLVHCRPKRHRPPAERVTQSSRFPLKRSLIA
jgi:hypothetical protein